MLRTRLCLFALTLLPSAWAQEDKSQPPQADEKRIQELIQRLGAKTLKAREAAQEELIKIASSAEASAEAEQPLRKFLEKAAKGNDSEVKSRANQVLTWIEPKESESGITLKLRVNVMAGGRMGVSVDITNKGYGDQHISDPAYWNNWQFFTLEVMTPGGKIRNEEIQSSRPEGNFSGMSPAKVLLREGETKVYEDGYVDNLEPGTYRLRVTAKRMLGAKGYEGRSPQELRASEGATALASITIEKAKQGK